MQITLPIILTCLLATGCADKKPPAVQETPKVLFEGGWNLFETTVFTKFTYFPSDAGGKFELRWMESDKNNKCMEFTETWSSPFKESDLPNVTLPGNTTFDRDISTYLKKPQNGFEIPCENIPNNKIGITQEEWNNFYYFSGGKRRANIPYGQLEIVDLNELKELNIDPIYFGSTSIVFHDRAAVSPVMDIVGKKVVAIYMYKDFLLQPKTTYSNYKIPPLSESVNPYPLIILMNEVDKRYAEINQQAHVHAYQLSSDAEKFCYRTKKAFQMQKEARVKIALDIVNAIKSNDLDGLNEQYSFLKTNQGPDICKSLN